jgi:hypothetical protein
MFELSDQIERKYTQVVSVDDEWSVLTDSGWQPIEDVKETVPYEVWELTLSSGKNLECADNHIIFRENLEESFVKDLNKNDVVLTQDGLDTVVSVVNTMKTEIMYDLGVDSTEHRFYSNGILSHNSVTAAGYLLWNAMFVPDSTILVAAHKYLGAQEIMVRVRYAYESCPDYIRAGVISYNKGSIEFENGSRIVAQTTTENTGRGMSISLLYCDEFAFLRPSIARDFWVSISPTLSTGGRAIITSTPNSDEDQFATIWKQANKCVDEYGNTTELGINGFRAFKAEWWQHPDRDEVWKSEELGRIGEERFRREHGLEFLIDKETLISSFMLAEMSGVDPLEKQGQVRWFKRPVRGANYLVALDPSLGTGGDPAAIQVFEMPTLVQVAEWQHNKTPINKQIAILVEICKHLTEATGNQNSVYYSVENNNIGEAALLTIAELGEENIPGVFISEPARAGATRRYRRGYNTSHKTKLAACAKLKSLIESKKLTIYSKNLISELKNFVSNGTSYAAVASETDDLVMATILIVRMMQTLQSYDPELESRLKDNLDQVLEPMPFIVF